MKKSLLTILLFCGFLSSCQYFEKKAEKKDQLKGTWIGTINFKPYPELVSLTIDSTVISKFYYAETGYYPPIDVQKGKEKISFRVDHPMLKGNFEGEVKEAVLKATFEKRKSKGKQNIFDGNFIKIAPQSLAKVAKISGFYQSTDGNITIEVSPYSLDFTLTPLSILNFSTGKKRLAFPTDSSSYAAGFKMLSPYPKDMNLKFSLGDADNYTTLTFTDSQNATPIELRRREELSDVEEMTAKNGDISLAASVTFPSEEKEKYPLIVLVPAGGRQSRATVFTDYIKLFPYMGIATLMYDKRGCGASTGELDGSNFKDLANDLLAIIKEAKKNPRIDVSKIGVLGIDQAGFIMPLAASKTKDIKFIVNLSGAMVSVKEQEYIACENRMKGDGFSKKDIKEALAYQNKMFAYVERKLDSVSFQKASELAENASWKGYVTSFDKKRYIRWWEKHHNFSAVPYFSKLQIPVLSIYGENDILTLPNESQSIMQNILSKNKKMKGKTIILKGANHLLFLGGKRGDFQFSELEGYPKELFTTINKWVLEEVK